MAQTSHACPCSLAHHSGTWGDMLELLKGRDSSFVACSDSSERDRVREHFLKKKLGLAMPDAELDEAIIEICQRMAKDRDKHRVTFYYLLAEKYGKLAAFSK